MGDPRLISVLIDEASISRRIDELSHAIARDYVGITGLVVVGVMKGACIFTADLVRGLSRAGMSGIRVEFIRVSTYGNEVKGPEDRGRVTSIGNLTCDVAGRRVLLVDDIVDQGFTMHAMKRHFLEALGASEVRTCAFLQKRLTNPTAEVQALRSSFQVDYYGFEVDDLWVVGYGLDVAEEFRELPYVAACDPTKKASSDESQVTPLC